MRKAAGMVLAGLMAAGPTAATGYELLPRTTERFADHAACVAALEAHRARELARRLPRQVGPGGEVREVQVVQRGFERRGPDRVSYGSEILVLEGGPDPASGRLRLQPRFELIIRDCEGAEMISGGSRHVLRPVFE
jgi:hypothetical protein